MIFHLSHTSKEFLLSTRNRVPIGQSHPSSSWEVFILLLKPRTAFSLPTAYRPFSLTSWFEYRGRDSKASAYLDLGAYKSHIQCRGLLWRNKLQWTTLWNWKTASKTFLHMPKHSAFSSNWRKRYTSPGDKLFSYILSSSTSFSSLFYQGSLFTCSSWQCSSPLDILKKVDWGTKRFQVLCLQSPSKGWLRQLVHLAVHDCLLKVETYATVLGARHKNSDYRLLRIIWETWS
jgi:hypothetical protein